MHSHQMSSSSARNNKVMAACTLGSDPVAAVIAELMYSNQLPPADQIK